MEIEVNEMITSGKLIQLIYIFFFIKGTALRFYTRSPRNRLQPKLRFTLISFYPYGRYGRFYGVTDRLKCAITDAGGSF